VNADFPIFRIDRHHEKVDFVSKVLIGICALCVLALAACQSAPAKPDKVSYVVTYNANGATGGAVPTDPNGHVAGSVVTVLGNTTGTLVNTGFAFDGWSTDPKGTGVKYGNGIGTTYDVNGIYGDSTFTMGSARVDLYAVWIDPIVGPWNLTSLNGQAVALAPPGFEDMTFTANVANSAWTISSAPKAGGISTSTGSWSVSATTPATYNLTSGNMTIFTAAVSGSTLTVTPTSPGSIQVMVFSKH
jgi:hypothetical protein